MNYKANKNELPKIESVLKRDSIPYDTRAISEQEVGVDVDIPEERFAEVLVDAECENLLSGHERKPRVCSLGFL